MSELLGIEINIFYDGEFQCYQTVLIIKNL